MSKNSLTSETGIEAEFEMLLAKCNNEKLLTLDSGVAINMLFFLHPSPKPLIKMVIHRRRIEDLVLLSQTMPQASTNVIKVMPNIKEADHAKKIAQILKTFSEESREFDKFTQEMSAMENREAIVRLQNGANELMMAYSESGFDADAFFSKHPNVLSIMMDWYLVYQLLSAASSPDYSKEDFETAMNLIWEVRDLLSNYRVKGKN